METLLHAGLSNAVTATFLALLVASLGRVLARRPAVLHCLWLLVLLKLVTPPLYEVPIPWPKPFAEVQESATPLHFVPFERIEGAGQHVLTVPGVIEATEIPAEGMVLELIAIADRNSVASQGPKVIDSLAEWLPSDWMPLVAMIWLAGTVLVLVLSAKRVWQFQLLLREARPACEDTQEWVDELATRLGVLRPPSVWWIGGKLSPLVWALGLRPRLIIPTDLWKGLDEHQRSTLIVHELAHLRRGDHRVRIFELIVTALFWWHPVLWWVRQALRDVEEQCCDAWVVWAFPDSAKSYAETLLETLDFLNQSDRSVPLLASGFGKVHHLRKRLTMIMSGTTPRLLGVRGTLASLGMAALLLPVNATWAQKPDQKKDVTVIVKSDDDSAKIADVARIEGDLPEVMGEGTITLDLDDVVVYQDADTLTAQDTKQPRVVHLEVKTDDSSLAVTANSLEEAIDKLKDQIKALAKKSSPADQEKAKKALQSVIQELESQVGKQKGGESRVVRIEKGKPEHQLQLYRIGQAGKAEIELGKDDLNVITEQVEVTRDTKNAPGTKAEIEKARAMVKQLARNLERNQRQLMDAQKKLSQLEGGHHPLTLEVHALPHVTAHVARVPEVTHAAPGQRVEVLTHDVRGNGSKPDGAPTEQHRFVFRERVENKQVGELDQGRLEEIEKQLKRLLGEVASLKKDLGK